MLRTMPHEAESLVESPLASPPWGQNVLILLSWILSFQFLFLLFCFVFGASLLYTLVTPLDISLMNYFAYKRKEKVPIVDKKTS